MRLLGVLAAVITGVLVSVGTASVNHVLGNAAANDRPPVNVTVSDNSVCDFVAPLRGYLAANPTQLSIRPSEVGQGLSCDKALAKVHGAVSELSLEAVLAPSGDAAIVLTDVTVHVLSSSPVGRSAFYSPAGSGGGGDTLSIDADVEKTPAVDEVDNYAADGNVNRYTSVIGVRPRPIATKADPLIVDISLHGDTKYTKFEIELHWQSSTASGVLKLDNGGSGYTLAGLNGIPDFRGESGDIWVAGTN